MRFYFNLSALFFFLVLLISSCTKSNQKEQVSQNNYQKTDQNTSKPEVNKLKLSDKLHGEWINAALFDSTLSKKQLQPWLASFYGDIILKINATDSVVIEGNMDGAKTQILINDPFQFTMPNRTDKPVFKYKEAQDKIILTNSSQRPIIFRRKRKSDNFDFMGDEEKFNRFFISQLFDGNYIEVTKGDSVKISIKNQQFIGDSKRTKIEGLWNGFETFTPFDFDAIKLKEINSKEAEFYGWEFAKDTLKIYSTSHTFDDESGFPEFKKGLLYRKLIKSK